MTQHPHLTSSSLVVVVLAGLSLVISAGCGGTGMNNQNDALSSDSSATVSLPQGERTDLGDVLVGCLGLATDSYTTADGTQKKGLTGQLSIPGQESFLVVGPESEFEAGGAKWRVLSVTENPDTVTVRQLAD